MPYEYEGDPDYEKFCDDYDEGHDHDLEDFEHEDECDDDDCEGECARGVRFSNNPDDDDYLIDGVGFANPGGNSALRAATPENPRNIECPECGQPNRLTPLDAAKGYRCDECADRAERGGY
jgi:hypothetical protein